MAFNIVHLNGEFESQPSIEMFSALFEEIFNNKNIEHTDVSVSHESEWHLSLFSNGKLVWENVEDSSINPKYLYNLPKEKVIELWTKLAQGKIESIHKEIWLKDYQ